MPNNSMREQEELLKEMRDSYAKGTLIPFIGAGFSKNIPGYPTWAEFIKIICGDLRNTGVKIDHVKERRFKNNPLEATEYYIRKKGEQEKTKSGSKYKGTKFKIGKQVLLDKLATLFNNQSYNKKSWSLHNALMGKKKFKLVYTTNWDNTLERSNGKQLTPIFRVEQFKNERGSRSYPAVIKFHGHFDFRSDSLIACETDYMKRIFEENPFDIKFKNDLLHNDFLFIGYSFNDPNVKLVLYGIKELLKDVHFKHRPNIYWISADHKDNERVNLLPQMFDEIIKPYFLLMSKQEDELKAIEDGVKINCSPCSFYWECDNTKCLRNKRRKQLIKKLEERERKLLKSQLKHILGKF